MSNVTQEAPKKVLTFTSIKKHISLRLVVFFIVILSFSAMAFPLKVMVLSLVENNRTSELTERLYANVSIIESLIYDESTNTQTNDYQGIAVLADAISARIVVVDTDYFVAFDSAGTLSNTFMTDSDVYDVLTQQSEDVFISESSYMGYIFPVTDDLANVIAVVTIGLSTADITSTNAYLNYRANIIICIFEIFALVIAIVLARLSARDAKRITGRLKEMKNGFLGDLDSDGLWAEGDELTVNINEIFAKASLLEESRQEFVSNVSHELKTPITSMKVLSESLLMQDDVPAEMYREFMNDIVLEIDREAQIINDLLTLVKTDKDSDNLNLETVDINELMEIILKRLTPIAKNRGIEITYESYREVRADIDKVKFTLAISNLIENGIKYNVDNGWIRVSLNADHKNLYIKVADSGVGIPSDCLDHIFERFYRVDKARSRDTGGTGLGLAITRNIILMHSGNINVYSEPGKGTTFTVRIPNIVANEE